MKDFSATGTPSAAPVPGSAPDSASRCLSLQNKIRAAIDRLQRLHAAVPVFPLESLRQSIRAAAKRYFDLLKNAVVVATIGYLASKAQSRILSIVAVVSFVMFTIDWMISLLLREFTPFSRMPSKTWARVLNGLFTVAFAMLLGVLFWLVVFALDEFGRAQLPAAVVCQQTFASAVQ
jgi:hypothetical protein